jgi:hypothetical protein
VGHVYTGDRAFEGLFTERQVSAVITSAMPHCSRLIPNSKPSTHPAVPGKPDQMIAARTILAIPATSTHPHVNQLMPRFGHCFDGAGSHASGQSRKRLPARVGSRGVRKVLIAVPRIVPDRPFP